MRITLDRVSIWLDHQGVDFKHFGPVMWVTLDKTIGATAAVSSTPRVGIVEIDGAGIDQFVDELWSEIVVAHVNYLGYLANYAADYVAKLTSWAGIKCEYGLNKVVLRVEPDYVATRKMAEAVRYALVERLHSLCFVYKVSGANALICEVAVSEFTDMDAFWSAPDIIRQSIARFAGQGVNES